MNQPRDIERLLDQWFADGSSVAPDRVIDIVADRIERQPQRPLWRLDWRHLTMNTTYKIAAAIAAIAILGLIGWNLLPGGSTGVGGPAPTASPTVIPTASPSVTPATTPAASAPAALPDGVMTAGRYRIKPLDASSLSIVAAVPAGWVGYPSNAAITSPEGNSGGILLSFMKTDGLLSDPCHWDLDHTGESNSGDVVVGPTVDDLVAGLKANKSYTSSAASPVALSGFAGEELELQLPGDEVLSRCDKSPGDANGTFYVFPRGFYAQGPNSRWHLYINDVNGTRLITMISVAEGTPQVDVTAAEAIVESFQITP